MNKHKLMAVILTTFSLSSFANLGEIDVESRARANAQLAAQTYLLSTSWQIESVTMLRTKSLVNEYVVSTNSDCQLKVQVGHAYKARVVNTHSCF